jgi:CYTH domain-containing protein
MLVEVEFASVEDSARFSPPEWFGPEVTEDERYKNRQLAVHGLPGKPSAEAKPEGDGRPGSA